jgi:hypothetical protein
MQMKRPHVLISHPHSTDLERVEKTKPWCDLMADGGTGCRLYQVAWHPAAFKTTNTFFLGWPPTNIRKNGAEGPKQTRVN